MRIECFPDTNILLHFKPLDEIDWCALVEAEEVLLSICITVIHELDEKKAYGATARLRKRAQATIRQLELWSSKEAEIEIAHRVSLRFLTAEPRIDWRQRELDPAVPDDRILASALDQAIEARDRVALVTADLGARLKARARGLRVVTPGEIDRLPEILSEQEAAEAQLRERIRTLETREPKLDLDFVEAEFPHRVLVKLRRAVSLDRVAQEKWLAEKEAQLYRKLERPRETSALAGAFLVGISKDELDRYRSAIPKFLTSYRAFYEEQAAYREETARMFRVTLLLKNSGSAEADGIKVHLHVPDGVEVLAAEGVPKPPVQPEEPAPPRTFGELVNGRPYIPDLSSHYRHVLSSPPPGEVNCSGPSIRRSNSFEISYAVRALLHGFTQRLPPFTLAFPSWQAVQSLSIAYSLHARNLVSPVEGSLAVVMEVTE